MRLSDHLRTDNMEKLWNFRKGLFYEWTVSQTPDACVIGHVRVVKTNPTPFFEAHVSQISVKRQFEFVGFEAPSLNASEWKPTIPYRFAAIRGQICLFSFLKMILGKLWQWWLFARFSTKHLQIGSSSKSAFLGICGCSVWELSTGSGRRAGQLQWKNRRE